MKTVRYYIGFLLALSMWLLPLQTHAQTTFTSGVISTGTTTAILWFKPTTNASWVDAHYNTGAAPQNVRMTFNSSTSRFEQLIAASAGTTVNYSFTYNLNGPAYDTPPLTAVVGGPVSSSSSIQASSSSAPGSVGASSSSSVNGANNGVVDNGSSVILWYKPASSPTWADIHYNVNSTGQQNFRSTLNSATGRFEQVVAVTAGMPLNVTYYFTYGSPAGAFDTAAFNYVRSISSSSTIKSSSSAPSSAKSSTPSSITSSIASSIKSSMASSKVSSLASSIKSSVASSKSSTSSPCTVNCFQKGVAELGATATVWFKTTAAQATPVILHYSLTGQPGQINPQMTLNSTLGRWEAKISPVSCGAFLNYNFTYKDAMGLAQDSPMSTYELCIGLSNVVKPTFSPLPGSFFAEQDVTLSTTEKDGVIRYTLDGSAATALSPIYVAGTKIHVKSAVIINAITIAPNGEESPLVTGAYSIKEVPGTLQAPSFSHVSGTYNTVIRVAIASNKEGAFIHYTLDGSTPTANSPVYGAPIEAKIDPSKSPSNVTHIRAIAVKADWTTSAVADATYTITSNTRSEWNGLTKFNVVNNTGKPDNQVYWAIIGKDWNTDQFVHVDLNGALIPMSEGDNVVPKNGRNYANYFYSLAQIKSITIPAINSARLLMSVGSPMYIWVNKDINNKIGYAGANIENPDDANIDVLFDFGEFAILGKDKSLQGIFINTTRVDHFGFPVQLNVTGLDGFNQTVGESLTETRDQLFARFITETPAPFHGLAQAPNAPYRIIAPAHATFQTGGPNADYLKGYIDQVWEQYRHQPLILNLHNGWPTFTGNVVGDTLVFTDGLGSYRINGKPTTSMAMLGNGVLDDATGATGLIRDKQLQLQAQVCAALNRHVAHLDGEKWHNSAFFYPEGEVANYFTKFWHDHSLNGLAYGFSYDDVGSYSPSIYTWSPVSVTYTIGK